MKRHALSAVVVGSLVGLMAWSQAGGSVAIAQDKTPKASAKVQAKQARAKRKATPKQAPVRRKARGRLPMYYGQIGLTDEQRTKIYEIQAKYRQQLTELRKQIAALLQKQSQEIEQVLTEEQKTKLAELQEAGRKKRAARAKKSKPSS